MKYLFFDLEYASCKDGDKKICEFGYVVTDEQFAILEEDNLIINPNINRADWDYRALRDILTRTRDEYERCFKFNHFYNRIANLINTSDCVFGHTIDGDAVALNQNCERYNLDYINYEFYDVREIYKNFSNGEKSVGVSGILEEMGLSGLANSHDAMADAYNTMIILKGILDRTGKSLTELLEENQNARDKTENGVVESIALAEKFLKEHLTGDGSNLFYTELNNKRYKQFLIELKAHCKGNSRLQKAKISISKNYLYDHYRQALNLTQLIFESGGVVKRDESILPDIYVMYETPKELIGETDAEFDFIQEGAKNGAEVKIISFNELLELLRITNEQLENMPMPSFEFLLEKRKRSHGKKKNSSKKEKQADFTSRVVYADGNSGASIAELLKLQGVAI
ncbi:MAG: hypothetical protein J6V71_00090 [Clostridia bacterium]|nr:hypothetical protein [Clostridia bacterium]